jgi:hypothetical protein
MRFKFDPPTGRETGAAVAIVFGDDSQNESEGPGGRVRQFLTGNGARVNDSLPKSNANHAIRRQKCGESRGLAI